MSPQDELLLVWPSSLLDSPEDSGFVLGWKTSREGSTVVAGIVRVENEDCIAKKHSGLEEKIELLQKDQSSNALKSFEIVSYFSNQSTISDATTAWLTKLELPVLHSKGGYPQFLVKERTAQVILYDPRNVYKHDLSEAASAFGSILERASAASSLMKHMAGLSDKNSELLKAEVPSKPEFSTKGDNNNPQLPKKNGILEFLERNSLLAYHFSSTRQKRHWTPVVRLWHAVSKSMELEEHQATNDCISSAADLAMGMAMGAVFAAGSVGAASSFYVEQRFLAQWLDWLESFPIGFKLNVSLTHAIGQEIRSCLILRQNVLGFLLAKPWYYLALQASFVRPMLVLTCTLLGGSGCLALLMDLVRLLTLHLRLFQEGFRYVYSTELYLLGTSWRLFRGKKQNVLRHRTDTMQYDSMQLLLGSILFVTTLFLATTVLVYYAFFTLLHLTVGAGTTVALWWVYVLLQDFPFGTCYHRIRRPERFTWRVVISEIDVANDDPPIIVTRLDPIPEPILTSILKANNTLPTRARRFSSWLGTLISGVFSGRAPSKSLVESLAFDA